MHRIVRNLESSVFWYLDQAFLIDLQTNRRFDNIIVEQSRQI